jgi:multisubunit Na+/H+ antiporter MnhG subunit
MNEILISILLVVGSFFMLVAAVGMMRMPDLFLRMSCSTKAATIGVGTLLNDWFHFSDRARRGASDRPDCLSGGCRALGWDH